MNIEQLQDLAASYNIQLTYEDAAGKRRSASRDALINVLRVRSGKHDLAEALRDRKEELAARKVEPVHVVWGRSRPRIPCRGEIGEWHLQLEDGTTQSGRGDLPSLPFGYHVLTIGDCETFLICAPMRAHSPGNKTWGVLAPLYSIRTERSWGTGDLGDLRAYREWVTELGGGVVGTLPILAIDAEGDPSPYSPLSRLYWNEMYLEIERMPEFDSNDLDAEKIGSLQKTERVDYAGVMREKRRVLEKMLTRFRPDAEYEEFAKRARAYAKFRGDEKYHLYVQFRMSQQMREFGKGLYLDFPLGVNPKGFDASHYSAHFVKGVSVGAPPDLFFTKGQNWGFPPFDPDAIREHRYDYFRECIRLHTSHASMLRIDHVMGLHRTFWIPEGTEAKDGVFVQYRAEELYAILALESARNRCAITGEDLGTVPKYVPAMMKKHGVRRMYVVQYEVKPDADPPIGMPAAESVASINTHDMPAFAAFWNDKKNDRLRASVHKFLTARGLLHDREDDTKCVLDALLRFLAASDAEIVLVNLEDLWLETEPQNMPGKPERSWRQKFKFTLEQMKRDSSVVAPLQSISKLRREVDGNTT